MQAVLKICAVLLTLVFAGCGNGGGGGDSEASGSEPTPLTYTIDGIIEAPDNALADLLLRAIVQSAGVAAQRTGLIVGVVEIVTRPLRHVSGHVLYAVE